MSEIANRCYRMEEKFVYDSLTSGYYMIPGERGLFNIETGQQVAETGRLTVETLDQFVLLIRGVVMMQPGVLR